MGKDSAVGGVTQWERTVQWKGHTLKEDSAVGGVTQWERTVQWEGHTLKEDSAVGGSRNERGQCSGRVTH